NVSILYGPADHSNRKLRFRPPGTSLLVHDPDFDFLHEFFGRFSIQNGGPYATGSPCTPAAKVLVSLVKVIAIASSSLICINSIPDAVGQASWRRTWRLLLKGCARMTIAPAALVCTPRTRAQQGTIILTRAWKLPDITLIFFYNAPSGILACCPYVDA